MRYISDIFAEHFQDYIEVHEPILQLSADGVTFTLHMPLLGMPNRIHYLAIYDADYIIFVRNNSDQSEKVDKTVFFLIDREEYSVDTTKSLLIKEAFYDRPLYQIECVFDDNVTGLAHRFFELERPYFPFSPFAYYYNLFIPAENPTVSCSCCGKISDIYYNNTIHQPGILFDERVLPKEFHICPKCVAEGKLSNINGYKNEKNSHLLRNCTPGVRCTTNHAMEEYIEVNEDGCFYCDDWWPYHLTEDDTDILPVFIGYLRKCRDNDVAPYLVLLGERADVCNNIGYENMEMLYLDEITKDSGSEYAKEINKADIRVFAHFTAEGDGLFKLPRKDGKLIVYSLDVPLRGHPD